MRLVYPLLLVVAFGAAVAWVVPTRSAPSVFDQTVQRIQTADLDRMPELIAAAERYIQFQEAGYKPAENPETAQSIADLYFLAGQAILSREDTEFLHRSIEWFQNAIRYYPALRKGWLYYQLGMAYERLGRHRDAVDSFSSVHLVGSGRLPLQAGYRAALNIQAIPGSAIPGKLVYNYLRYESMDWNRDLTPFLQAAFDESNESTILRCLIQSIAGDTAGAKRELARYRARYPTDYYAAFLFDSISVEFTNIKYPTESSLLPHGYAPKSFRDGYFDLIHDGHLLVDVYVPHPEQATLQVHLTVSHPLSDATPFAFRVNSIDIPPVRTIALDRGYWKIEYRVDRVATKNILSLHFFIPGYNEQRQVPLTARIVEYSAELTGPKAEP